MSRKTILLLIATCSMCIVLLIFSGCGNKSTINANESSMEIGYIDGSKIYNGNYIEYYSVEEGKTGELKFKIDKTKGEINILVTNNDEKFYTGTDLQTCEFSVVGLTPGGEYKVHVQCKNFVGDYGIEWLEK